MLEIKEKEKFMKIEEKNIKIKGILFECYIKKQETIDLSQSLWKKVYNHLEEPGFIKISETFKVRNKSWADILTALGYESTTFDWAVPENYYSDFIEIFRMPSDMVWYYPKGNYFGEPMFLEDILERFCSLVKRHVVEVGFEPV